ncbi:MAG: N-acetyltransferase [Nanoarchaeota archaeon]|nr:N-acetyltransferase [Nanoarchaeota archaeon]
MKTRTEKKEDYETITQVNNKAFERKEEGILINELRKRREYKSELSLVAIKKNKIVGHLLLFPIFIETNSSRIKTLSLGPIAVLPEYQKQGVGKSLVKEGIEKAIKHGFKSIVVIGHPKYYPKFGFKRATNYKVKMPKKYENKIDNPNAFMILKLEKNSLKNIEGTLVFPEEFDDAM